jgi:hypothetical protein
VGVLFGILIAAMVMQVGYQFLRSGTAVLWYLEFVLAVGIGVVFFLSELTRRQQVQESPEQNKPIAALSALGLKPDDIHILRRILQKEKYQNIAADCKMSLATFNRHVRQLFAGIGVANQEDFCRLYFDTGDEKETP